MYHWSGKQVSLCGYVEKWTWWKTVFTQFLRPVLKNMDMPLESKSKHLQHFTNNGKNVFKSFHVQWSADFGDLRVLSLAVYNKQALSVCPSPFIIHTNVSIGQYTVRWQQPRLIFLRRAVSCISNNCAANFPSKSCRAFDKYCSFEDEILQRRGKIIWSIYGYWALRWQRHLETTAISILCRKQAASLSLPMFKCS